MLSTANVTLRYGLKLLFAEVSATFSPGRSHVLGKVILRR